MLGGCSSHLLLVYRYFVPHVAFESKYRIEIEINGWMEDLRVHVLFNSISVISGRWADDNERLCAMEPHLRLRRFRLGRGSNPGPPDQLASA